jgi:rare lipoprotein A
LIDEVGYAGIIPGGTDGVAAHYPPAGAPAFAEVTALDSGRTILVHVVGGDQPSRGHAIDLSCGAVRQLGLSTLPAAVRVRRVTPPEQEQVALVSGRDVAERLPSPPGLLSALRRKLPAAPRGHNAVEDCSSVGEKVDGASTPAPASAAVWDDKPSVPAARTKASRPSPAVAQPRRQPPLPTPRAEVATEKEIVGGKGFAIQVAALSDRTRANALARSIGGQVVPGAGIYRVRTASYPTQGAARAALPAIRAKGFADARVVTNEGR